MDVLSKCLIKSKYWKDGNEYVYCLKNSIPFLGNFFNILITSILYLVNCDYTYVAENPINNPVVMSNKTTIETNVPLAFERTLCNKNNKFIKTSDKYIVDATKYNDFESYLKNLNDGHHRQIIRRFQKKCKEGNAQISKVDITNENFENEYNCMLPLYQEVQARNHGTKGDIFLYHLLKACVTYPEIYECKVVVNNNSKEYIAFAIFMHTTTTITSSNNNNFNEKCIFVPAIGNCFEKGHKILAYHNLLAEAVNMSIKTKSILDFGYAHYQVKKIFEPMVVSQYLRYVGNSALIEFIIFLYTNVIKIFKR